MTQAIYSGQDRLGSTKEYMRHDDNFLRVWEAPLEARPFGRLLVSLCFELWREINATIFEEKWRTVEMLWDLLHLYSSFWASYTNAFKNIPFNVIRLNWHSMCSSKEFE